MPVRSSPELLHDDGAGHERVYRAVVLDRASGVEGVGVGLAVTHRRGDERVVIGGDRVWCGVLELPGDGRTDRDGQRHRGEHEFLDLDCRPTADSGRTARRWAAELADVEVAGVE